MVLSTLPHLLWLCAGTLSSESPGPSLHLLWLCARTPGSESPSLSCSCLLTGERERISVATVCGPGIMAAAPFPDLRLFSWGDNSAQMARSQVSRPPGEPGHVTMWSSSPQGGEAIQKQRAEAPIPSSLAQSHTRMHACTLTPQTFTEPLLLGMPR